ncbi:hypothetical protein MBLNU230_g0551t1 [Neophaeotheca triangularis]
MADSKGPSILRRKPRSTPTGLAPDPLNIVILGASYGGLSCAHHFLDETISRLESTTGAPTYRLVLISPSTHLYWNIGAPRALVKPGLMKEEDLFAPIEPGFHRHRGMPFLFIQGEAKKLDPTTKTLTIECITNAERKRISSVLRTETPSSTTTTNPSEPTPVLNEKGEYPNPKLCTLPYHAVICATGSSAHSDLLTLHGPHTSTIGALQSFHTRVSSARTILICGGGPSGVETASQLSTHYNHKTLSPLLPLRRRLPKESRKQIILVTSNSRLLPQLQPSLSASALKHLQNLGIDVRFGVRVEKVEEEFDLTGQTRVSLSGEAEMIVDAYVACTGVTPNSSYLPRNLVDEKGRVNCHSQTLRVQNTNFPNPMATAMRNLTAVGRAADAGLAATDAETTTLHPERVYAVGDCARYSRKYLPDVYAAVPTVMQNLLVDLLRYETESTAISSPATVAVDGDDDDDDGDGDDDSPLKDSHYRPPCAPEEFIDLQLCPTTRFGGLGVLWGWAVPGWVVWVLKGRDYRTRKIGRVVGEGGTQQTQVPIEDQIIDDGNIVVPLRTCADMACSDRTSWDTAGACMQSEYYGVGVGIYPEAVNISSNTSLSLTLINGVTEAVIWQEDDLEERDDADGGLTVFNPTALKHELYVGAPAGLDLREADPGCALMILAYGQPLPLSRLSVGYNPAQNPNLNITEFQDEFQTVTRWNTPIQVIGGAISGPDASREPRGPVESYGGGRQTSLDDSQTGPEIGSEECRPVLPESYSLYNVSLANVDMYISEAGNALENIGEFAPLGGRNGSTLVYTAVYHDGDDEDPDVQFLCMETKDPSGGELPFQEFFYDRSSGHRFGGSAPLFAVVTAGFAALALQS